MKTTLIILLMLLTGCDFPKDPENSLDNARKDTLKVGVVNNPPYTIFKNGNAEGTEIELLKNFASSYDLQIKFMDGSESTLVEKLKKYQLHIVAGGFDKKTIWKKHACTSVTYDSKHLFLIPKGENKLLHRLETNILQNHNK